MPLKMIRIKGRIIVAALYNTCASSGGVVEEFTVQIIYKQDSPSQSPQDPKRHRTADRTPYSISENPESWQ